MVRYCKEAGKHNAFTSGCAPFKKDTLKKHVAIVDHRIVLTAKSGKRDMQRAIGNIHWNREHAVYAALWTVYFMGEKNLPNNIFADLKHFQILQISNTPVRWWISMEEQFQRLNVCARSIKCIYVSLLIKRVYAKRHGHPSRPPV